MKIPIFYTNIIAQIMYTDLYMRCIRKNAEGI